MTTIVIMPGGFHPYHAGHHALYQSAQRAFPDAEVFVAATNDTSSRPFPFAVKEKLAKLAGVEAGHFVQVKSPFRAEEITSRFDPQRDVLIFVRSEKDAGSQPQPGGVKKDGSASYLQPLLGAEKLEPFAKHAYMAYLPTVEFGPGMTSATQIRTAWPTLNEKRKTALVMSLYPVTQKNPRLAATVVKLLDAAIGTESVAEGLEYADKLSGLVDLPVFNSSTNPTPSGVAKVVNTGDRIMVVMNVRGVNVPYYISTGSGGKASVPTGKWYPVFGVHSSGWLNKGGEDSINKFYGSKMLALNADRLNNALGDLSSVEAQIPFMKKTGIAIINKDLQPMSHSEVSANPDEFKKRVNLFLAKLGSDPFYQVKATQPQGVAPGSLNEFAPSGDSATSYYAVTSNFVNEFSQQKQEQLQDLIDAGWTKQDLAQSGQEQSDAADIAHFEQVRDSFLKGLKPGFDAYLQGDTQLKDQLGAYWIDNDLPLNQDWEKIYSEPWGDDGEFNEGMAEASLEDRLKKYVRPVVKTTPKIERTTNPAGRTTDHVEWKVTGPMGDVTRFSSKKAAQAHYDSFGKLGPDSLNEFAPGDGDDEENPLDDYPCYDCGSTIYMHHTRLCDFAEPDAVRDLPAKPGTQHWTGRVPKGLTPIPGLSKSVEETVSANGTTANTSGAGAGMTASYQRRENQPIAEDYLDERRL